MSCNTSLVPISKLKDEDRLAFVCTKNFCMEKDNGKRRRLFNMTLSLPSLNRLKDKSFYKVEISWKLLNLNDLDPNVQFNIFITIQIYIINN